MSKNQKTYTKEFRQEAVRLLALQCQLRQNELKCL